jgi:alkylated DNA repair dioxygenase AlkB
MFPTELQHDVLLMESFVERPEELFRKAITSYPWQNDMRARQTASFGAPYTSSHVNYPHREFPPEIWELLDRIERAVGWRPNNCLLNHYASGGNTMGFHSDDKSTMELGTGVVIVSLGAERALTFRKVGDPAQVFSVQLPSGSLFCMSRDMQDTWQHAVAKDLSCDTPRISLTFRKIPVKEPQSLEPNL